MNLTYAPHKTRDNTATIEHLRRQADGGRHRLENLALSCKQCNDRRGTTDWLTYCSWIRNEF